jgi:hypothetical protein
LLDYPGLKDVFKMALRAKSGSYMPFVIHRTNSAFNLLYGLKHPLKLHRPNQRREPGPMRGGLDLDITDAALVFRSFESMEEASEKYQGSYLQLAAQAMRENPMLHADLHAAHQFIQKGDLYRALKGLKKLIRTEAFAVGNSPSAKYIPRVNGWKESR